jgi:hypothetical protein
LCAGLLAAVSVPAWSLDDRAPPTTDNNEVPSASIDTGSDAVLTPASQDSAATGTSGDPTTATTGAAVDPDPTSGSELPASARSNAPTGLALSDPMGKSTDADRIERLEQQLEALLTEIRSLRGGRGEYGRSMAMPAWRTAANRANSAPAFSPDGKLIAVVTEDGRIAVLEAGTGKEVRRIDLGAAASTQVLMFNPQGTILYACADDGSYVQYDVASGKQLSRSVAQRPVPNYGDDRSSVNQPVPGGTTAAPPAASPGAPLNDFTPTAHASTAANPFAAADAGASSSGGLAQSLAGAQIDLIRLATEYTEAAGEKKLAERQLSRIHGLERANAISEEQVVTAEVQFETAANKLALLRAIAEAAAEATKGELEFAERMADKGYASPANVTQLKAKLRIISLILDGGTGSSQ